MIKKQVCCLRHHFWGWTLAPINLDPYPIPQPQRNPEAIKPGTQVCRRRRNLNRNRHNKQDAQIAPRRVKDQHRSFSVSGEGPRTQGLKGLKDSRTQGLKDSRTQGLKDSRTQGLKDSMILRCKTPSEIMDSS